MVEIEIRMDFLKILKKNWVMVTLIAIFILSFLIRLSNFHWPYLLNIDSYYHYRYMRYIAEGKTETLTIIRNGKLIETSDLKYDPLVRAPNGGEFKPNPYHFVGAYSYLLVKLFFPNLELWRFLIYFPVFITSLMCFPAYLLGKTIYDKKAGILFAFLTVFNPAIMSRTVGGDPDNDCWVLLLPLIVLSTFFLAYKISKKEAEPKISLFYAFFSGIWFTIFAHSWASWYIFYLILGFLVLISIIKIIIYYKKDNWEKIKKEIFRAWIVYAVFLLTFIFLSFSFSGTAKIKSNVFGPFTSLKLKAEIGQFPNVYVSVAELMASGNIRNVASRTGVILFTLGFISLFFMAYTFLTRKKELEPLILLGLWIIAPLYASLVAIRFTILLALPLSLATAILLSKLWALSLRKGDEE